VATVLEVELWVQRFGDELKLLNYAESSIARYTLEVRRFLRFLDKQGLSQISGMTRQHLYAYRNYLSSALYRGRKLKAGSQAHRLSAVLSFVRALVRLDYLLVDISQGVELPRRHASIPRVILSEGETLRLLQGPNVNRLAGLRDRALLEMLYATGLRNLELCHLDLADLDPAEGLLLVRKGKGGRDRKVPVGQEAWIWVEEYLAQCRPQWLSDASEQALFLGRFGKRLAKQDLTVMVARWAKRVGLEKRVTPHCLRHTCATHMLRRGASLRHLQVMLGHQSVVTTQIYTRVELSDLRKVLQRCHPRENLSQ